MVTKKMKKEKELKQEYNHLLKRYYNGCNYLDEHPNESEKYMPVILQLLERINEILEKVPATEEEVLNGFKT